MKIILITQKKNSEIILFMTENSDFGILDEPKVNYGIPKLMLDWNENDIFYDEWGVINPDSEIKITIEICDNKKDVFLQSITNLNLGIEICENIELKIRGKIDIEKYREKESYIPSNKRNKENKEDLFDILMDDPDSSYDTFEE